MPETLDDCVHFDEELSALLDGELTAEREASVGEHLAGCSACRSRLVELRAVDAGLRGLPPPRVPAGLEESLVARVLAEDRGPERPARADDRLPRPRRAVAPALVAAVLAAAAAISVYLSILRSPRFLAPEAPVARQELPSRIPPRASEPPRPARIAERAPTPEPAAPPLEPADAELDAASDEELSVAIDLETLEDLEVIANLDLLERMNEMGRKDHG
jgi:hypothetical protein